MMKITSTFSSAIFAFVSWGCLFKFYDGKIPKNFTDVPPVSIVALVANSTLRLLRDYHHRDGVFCLHSFTETVQYILLPILFLFDMWTINNYGLDKIVLSLFTATLGFALIFVFLDHVMTFDEIIVIISLFEIFNIGFLMRNWFSVSAGLAYFLAYFYFIENKTVFNIPPGDMFNLSCALFTYFIFMSLDGGVYLPFRFL